MIASRRLCLGLVLLSEISFAGALHGQERRGGMPGNIPMPRDFPTRGPPDWVGNTANRAASGFERADAAQELRLSKSQADRAALVARASPADYELDRNGALAIRGEVLVAGLDAARLARIERAGFAVLRRSEVSDLGMSLAVVAHGGLTAARAVERLRQIDPEGSYDLNHVFFESAAAVPERAAPATAPTAEDGRAAVVGMIDTGVAAVVDSPRRVRIVRRSLGLGQAVGPHGTAIAALLAREPGAVTIYAADIFGAGPRGGTAELLVGALAWMASQQVPVINVSIVGPFNELVATATGVMIRRGFTIVAPVGNDGTAAKLLYPASYPGVIAVSAADASGRLLPEASRVKRLDFVGPGIATVPDPSGRATVVRGTSFAAPIVSRQVADDVRSPDPSSARRAIARLIRLAVRPQGVGGWFGHGLIGIDAVTTSGK